MGGKAASDRRVAEFVAPSAQALLAALATFSGVLPRGCLFRGQSNKTWPLVPKVFRRLDDRTTQRDYSWTAGDQLKVEIQTVLAFVNACEDQGLFIPGGRDEVCEILYRRSRHNTKESGKRLECGSQRWRACNRALSQDRSGGRLSFARGLHPSWKLRYSKA